MRRKSNSRRLRKKVKGIILSTEMILLLTAVIMFAVVAFFGISKAVLSQATSAKQTLVVVRAEAWKVGSGVAVSLYVHNTGSEASNVIAGGIKYSYNGQIYRCEQSFRPYQYSTQGIVVKPGESKVISFAVGQSTDTSVSGVCDYVQNINPGDDIYVYVKIPITITTTQEVGTGVKVSSP